MSNTGRTHFKKGNLPPKHKKDCKCFRCSKISWNKGIKTASIIGEKIRKSLLGKTGKDSRRWLGEKAKIKAKHMYIYKTYGLATKCDLCGDKKATSYEWSNISRTYKRDMSDWRQLCISCHRKYDHPKNR